MSRRDRGSPSSGPALLPSFAPAERWLEPDAKGRLLFRYGKFIGELLDDVSETRRGEGYIRWVLDVADLRPTPDEELALREAIGEIRPTGAGSRRSGTWVNVVVGHRSFPIPEEVARLFDEELDRLLVLTNPEGKAREAQAFEALVANSSTTPLEGLS